MKIKNVNTEFICLLGIGTVALAFYACLPPKQFPSPPPPKQFITDPASFPEEFSDAERDRHEQARHAQHPTLALKLWIRDGDGVVWSWNEWCERTGTNANMFVVGSLPEDCEAIYSPTKEGAESIK